MSDQRTGYLITLLLLWLVVFLLLDYHAEGWEGDDGGVDQWEVSVGRWADRVNNQMQLTPPPAPPTTTPPLPPHYHSWLRIAECESNGRWDINTGNGYYGGLQFSLTSWRGVGWSGYPHQHSMIEQMWAAERLLDLQGWGAWPHCSRYR